MSDGDVHLSLLLARAGRVLDERIAPIRDSLGVSADQWRVLTVLSTASGRTMTDLARRSVLPAAGATRAVDALVARSLVYRRVDPTDRRKVVVFLSARGAATLGPALESAAAVEAAIATEIGPHRFLALGDGLMHLVDRDVAPADQTAT